MRPDKPAAGSPEDWLRHARADLALARIPVGEDDLAELHCFHAQQAVEKGLKAVLLGLGIRQPRTHVIQNLLDLLPEKPAIPPEVRQSSVLTLYASETRYPGTEEAVTPEEHAEAVRLAASVVSWAEEALGRIAGMPGRSD